MSAGARTIRVPPRSHGVVHRGNHARTPGAARRGHVYADLRVARRSRPRPRLVSAQRADSPARTRDRFSHGGGWSGGTRTTGPDFRRYFARDGFAMASIEYRLTPSITFPANVEDVRTAVRWLKANAAAHALDPDRICLWGTSAGGHLAAVAGLAPRRTFEGTDNLSVSSAVTCVLDGYGPTRFDVMDSQTDEERPKLQTPVVTTNVGGGTRGPAPPAGAGAGAGARGAGGGRGSVPHDTRRHQSRGCSARPCRVLRIAFAPPARSRMSGRTRRRFSSCMALQTARCRMARASCSTKR